MTTGYSKITEYLLTDDSSAVQWDPSTQVQASEFSQGVSAIQWFGAGGVETVKTMLPDGVDVVDTGSALLIRLTDDSLLLALATEYIVVITSSDRVGVFAADDFATTFRRDPR